MLVVWERSVRATHHFLSEADVDALRPFVAQALATESVDWWVLEQAVRVVGFLGMEGQTIAALFIDPGHHRRGAGRLLVAHAQRLAPGSLAVDVNEQNETARRFYEALGFSVVGRSATDADGRPFPILHLERPPGETGTATRRASPPG